LERKSYRLTEIKIKVYTQSSVVAGLLVGLSKIIQVKFSLTTITDMESLMLPKSSKSNAQCSEHVIVISFSAEACYL